MPPPLPKLSKLAYQSNSFPEEEEEEEENATTSSSNRAPQKPPLEMRQSVDQRERAAMVLGSWERLSWYSRSYGESIPQTRLRFERILFGLEAESSGEENEWEDEGEGNGGGDKGKERETERDEKQKRVRRSDGSGRKRVGGKG